MKATLLVTCGFIASLHFLSAQPTPPATSPHTLLRIDRDKLCVTNGVVSALPDRRLEVDTPSSRAVVRVATAQSAEIRFRYLGPSESSRPLASGELRRQIGLKLRAQDSCNLVYAMWHIEPDSGIAVLVKHNAGKHTHEECGARGYVKMKARKSVALPKIRSGESHTLRADLHGTDLTVVADHRVVWEGTLSDDIFRIDGPVGFRTDNARFVLEYYAAGLDPGTQLSTQSNKVTPCKTSAGD